MMIDPAQAACNAGLGARVRVARLRGLLGVLLLVACGDGYYVSLVRIDVDGNSREVPTLCITGSRGCRGRAVIGNEFSLTDMTSRQVVWSIRRTAAVSTRMITWGRVPTGWEQVEPAPYLNADVRSLAPHPRWPPYMRVGHVYGAGPYAMRLLSLPAPAPAHHQFCWELAKGARFDSADVERKCIVSTVPTDRDETKWHGFEDP